MTAREYNNMIHELAYESVKRSLLWEHFTNAQCNRMSDELVHAIRRTINDWTEHRIQHEERAAGVSWS